MEKERDHARRNLAAYLLGAAIMKTAQANFPDTYRPTARVFTTSPPLIESILSSSTIPIRSNTGENSIKAIQPQGLVHPESYFAIYDYSFYYGSGGDRLAIWMNRGDLGISDIILKVGEQDTRRLDGFADSGIRISVILRSLAPEKGGAWFCRVNWRDSHG